MKKNVIANIRSSMMIGKKVKWLLIQYSQAGEPVYRTGEVVHTEGDWLVVKAHKVINSHYTSPFVIKRYHEVELAQ